VAYVPPTRSEFRTIIYRALRDFSAQVFGAATINDFIHEAMMDLSAYRPHETFRVMYWHDNTWSPPPEMNEGVDEVWLVYGRTASQDPRKPNLFIPHADYSTNRAGWDIAVTEGSEAPGLYLWRYWIGRMQAWAKREPANIQLVSFGYGPRTLPMDDDDVLDLKNPTDEFCITQHCKWLGYQMLNADRALYQQWLRATNNTDVSPTQLAGMLAQSEASFDRARRRSTVIRRIPATSFPSSF
jgi:hypothetical protein